MSPDIKSESTSFAERFEEYKGQVTTLLTQGGIIFSDGEIITHYTDKQGQMRHVLEASGFQGYPSRITTQRMSANEPTPMTTDKLMILQSGKRQRKVNAFFTLVQQTMFDQGMDLPEYGIRESQFTNFREYSFVPSDFLTNLNNYANFGEADVAAFDHLLRTIEENVLERCPIHTHKDFDFTRFLSSIVNSELLE